MVRVCCYDDCKRPFNVYGCSYATGKSFYCDACRTDHPWIYENCRLRQSAPDKKNSTHGICHDCMQKAQSQLKAFKAMKKCNYAL